MKEADSRALFKEQSFVFNLKLGKFVGGIIWYGTWHFPQKMSSIPVTLSFCFLAGYQLA